MSNLDKLAAVEPRAKREFELIDGVMIPFEEVSRKFLSDDVQGRFPKIHAKFQSDGNIFELSDEVLMPFACAVIANAIAGVDGEVTKSIQLKAEKMVEERIPNLARLRIMSDILEASMVGGFKRGQTAPSPKNRQQRRAAGKSPSAKSGARGRKPQPISA